MCTLALTKARSSSTRLRMYWSRPNATQPFSADHRQPVLAPGDRHMQSAIRGYREAEAGQSRVAPRIWMVDIVYVFAFKTSAGLLETPVRVVGSCWVEVR
ncbi:hypothetical protein GAR06_00689 [Micromonospora saelicesensis]|nr:hypothetical protein GAR06_00689 [Micromonospora saelicesensis]